MKLEEKIRSHENERDLYMKEIKKVENKLAKLHNVEESKLMEELKQLEDEEADLDKQLAILE